MTRDSHEPGDPPDRRGDTPEQELEHDLQQLYRARRELPDPIRLQQRVMRIPDQPVAGHRPGWLKGRGDRGVRMSRGLGLAGACSALALVGIVAVSGNLRPVLSPVGGQARIVVDATGAGDVRTIGEAIELAGDGDTIELRPGTYSESVTISRDVTLRAVGDPGAVIIDFTTSDATTDTFPDVGEPWPFGILLQDSDAVLEGVSLRGSSPGIAVKVDGGSPTLRGLSVPSGTDAGFDADTALFLTGGTTATITESTWSGYVKVVRSSPTFSGNTVTEGGVSIDHPESQPIVIGNTFRSGGWVGFSSAAGGLVQGNIFEGGDVGVDTGSDPVIRANTFVASTTEECVQCLRPGIYVRSYAWDPVKEGVTGEGLHELTPLIEGNDISQRATGIDIGGTGARPTLIGNTIHDNGTGVLATAGSEAIVRGNTFSTNVSGLTSSGSTITVEDNTVEGGATGITAVGGAVTLRGNRVTGATTGYVLGTSLTQVIDNHVCGAEVPIRVGADPVPELEGVEICS